jgi:hypothetical protein
MRSEASGFDASAYCRAVLPTIRYFRNASQHFAEVLRTWAGSKATTAHRYLLAYRGFQPHHAAAVERREKGLS